MSIVVSPLRAIAFSVTGFAFWVLCDSATKLAGQSTLPPYETIAFLGVFTTILIVAKSGPSRVKDLWPKRPRAQAIRALLSFGCWAANVVALKHLPLTTFYVVAFVAPLVIAILAALVLHERLTVPKTLAILVGFAGVLIAVNPTRGLSAGDAIGIIAVLVSVALYAVNTVWLRVMTQSESPASIIFFSGLIVAAIGGGLMFVHAVPVDARLLGILFAMAAFNLVGNYCIFSALRHAGAATVEQFHYTQIVTGAVVGFVVWHDVPTTRTLLGAAVIIAAGLYVVAKTRRTSPAVAPT